MSDKLGITLAWAVYLAGCWLITPKAMPFILAGVGVVSITMTLLSSNRPRNP